MVLIIIITVIFLLLPPCCQATLVLTSDGHVAEEEPAGDEALPGVAWGLLHDVQVRGVEAQGSGWETVSHQVDPQQLYRDQSLRDAQSGRQENAARRTRAAPPQTSSPRWLY